MGPGKVAWNPVRDQAQQHGTRQRRLEKRHDKRLEVGVDIPAMHEIRAMLAEALEASDRHRDLYRFARVRASRPPLG